MCNSTLTKQSAVKHLSQIWYAKEKEKKTEPCLNGKLWCFRIFFFQLEHKLRQQFEQNWKVDLLKLNSKCLRHEKLGQLLPNGSNVWFVSLYQADWNKSVTQGQRFLLFRKASIESMYQMATDKARRNVCEFNRTTERKVRCFHLPCRQISGWHSKGTVKKKWRCENLWRWLQKTLPPNKDYINILYIITS